MGRRIHFLAALSRTRRSLSRFGRPCNHGSRRAAIWRKDQVCDVTHQVPPFANERTCRRLQSMQLDSPARFSSEYARTGFHVEYKNAVNLVTDADRRAEQVIVDTIHRAYPDHSVLAEERGMEPGRDSPYRWIIDPLDGTTNFAHGFPLLLRLDRG